MPTPTEVVTDLLDRLEQPGGFADAVRATFTDTTRYLNVGMSDTTGIAEALAFVERFESFTGANCLRVEMLAIAENGETVFTERIDHLIAPDGHVVRSIRILGVFEVSGGKIAGWRDYFDTAALAPASPQPA